MTVNLKLLAEKIQDDRGYCCIDPITMPRTLSALRDGKPVEVTTGTMYDNSPKPRPILTIVEGGVTGYESWYVYGSGSLIDGGIMRDDPAKPFYANAGGMGYPSLVLNTGDIQAYINDLTDCLTRYGFWTIDFNYFLGV